MNLALAFGQPYEQLADSMSEREFRAWARHGARWGLPARRIELQLAQIAWLIAKTMGGATDVDLRDFLFDPDDTRELSPEEKAAVAKQAFAFNPRKRKS
jgi:hypothetical protein